MKKKLFILLLVVTLLGTAVPLYAQDAGLTLNNLAARVEAMVELVASMTERLTSFEERLAILEATATPTVTPTPSPTPSPTPPPSPTPTPTPTSSSPTVRMSGTMNVRAGPGTNYPILGQAASGDQFPISGKNPAGGWWQIIYGGQYGWVYSPLVTAINPELVQVASIIPTPPPTPVPPTATPIPPTPVPPPVAQPPAGPCAGIGGDGCKFRLRNTDLRHNGGSDLKLYIGFVHEGRGDEVQGIGGSYYVELHKDGGHVSAVNDSTRGQNSTHNGPQGNKYNYLKTVPLSQVPGGNVAGNYTIWVKDGTGERDSQNYTFTVSGGNGEVWLIFAQNN